MPQNTESVAYNLCKQNYYEIVGTFLECSLCNAGWPMKSGRIAFSFYTVPCRLNTGNETYVNENSNYPSPSWFWGFEETEIQLACPPVGEGQEYLPNVWVGRAERGSRPANGASILLEALAKLTQIDNLNVLVEIQFNVLKGTKWEPYFNISQTLSRKDTDLCLPCSRTYASDYIPVSPSSVVCHGDLRFIRINAGTAPWFEGCGPEIEPQPGLVATGPVCSFFDGTRLFTCFRALIYSLANPPLFDPAFTQMGLDQPDCEYTDPNVSTCSGSCQYTFDGFLGAWIPTTSSCPGEDCVCFNPPDPSLMDPAPSHGDTYNADCRTPSAVIKCNCLYGKKTGQNSVTSDHFLVLDNYFNLGCPGESNTSFQKVQWGAFSGVTTLTGIERNFEIIAKDVGNGSLCFVIRKTTFPYTAEVASSITVISSGTPYVMQVDFTVYNVRVYVYAMKFPNPDILPEICYTNTGTTPNCGSDSFLCSGTCTYVYNSFFDNWSLQSGNCSSNLGYTCSCLEPPDPATLSPAPINGDVYETGCQ